MWLWTCPCILSSLELVHVSFRDVLMVLLSLVFAPPVVMTDYWAVSQSFRPMQWERPQKKARRELNPTEYVYFTQSAFTYLKPYLTEASVRWEKWCFHLTHLMNCSNGIDFPPLNLCLGARGMTHPFPCTMALSTDLSPSDFYNNSNKATDCPDQARLSIFKRGAHNMLTSLFLGLPIL